MYLRALFAITEPVDEVFSPLVVCPNKINAFSLASKKRFSRFTFSSNDNGLI